MELLDKEFLLFPVPSYDFHIDMKLKAGRDKDLWDVAQQDELRLKTKRNNYGFLNNKDNA